MIDIHTHILPGVDDGARDMYDTLEMLRMSAECGVEKIVATPHCNIPGVFRNYFAPEYVECLTHLRNVVKREGIPIEVLPGMEAFATDDLPELIVQGKVMPLNQSRYILMEFDFAEEADFADDVLRRVREVGAKPVIAHPERYGFVQEHPEIVLDWRRKGYLIQINKGSFLGRFGRMAERTAYMLLEHNLVSVVASDAHSPYQRTPYVLDAYEVLKRAYPERYLDVIFRENPKRICENRQTIRFAFKPFTEEGWQR